MSHPESSWSRRHWPTRDALSHVVRHHIIPCRASPVHRCSLRLPRGAGSHVGDDTIVSELTPEMVRDVQGLAAVVWGDGSRQWMVGLVVGQVAVSEHLHNLQAPAKCLQSLDIN